MILSSSFAEIADGGAYSKHYYTWRCLVMNGNINNPTPVERCIFCDPDPSALIYKSDEGIVVVDYPFAKGHVLVASPVHATNLHDLDPKAAASMMALACKVSKRIVKEFGAVKTYVVAIGDKDPHFHVHLLPKWKDSDNLGPHVFGESGWAHGSEVNLSDDDISQLRNLLQSV